jgi:RNA polymerase primary sigma factor
MVTKVRSQVGRSAKQASGRTAECLQSDAQLNSLRERAVSFLGQEIRFIYCSEFESLEGDDTPIFEAEELLQELRRTSQTQRSASSAPASMDMDETIALQNWSAPDPLLTFEQEQVLFRALNLLRYRINRLRSRLSATNPSRKAVENIEFKMDLVERIRTQLVSSNLRLVSSIARRFSTNFGDVDEFSSDGCMILLGAIDRFDFSRRFRFSTYATHSIQRHFFRAWKVRQRRKERFPNAAAEMLCEIPQQDNDIPVCEDPESVVSHLLSQAEHVLDEREHQILMERFGLAGRDKKGRTLREIASDLGISKERVRQLQMKALEKLREILDPDQIHQDFLPGMC